VGDAAEALAVKLVREWDGPLCHSRLLNAGSRPVRIREVVLFDVLHGLPPETALYGEGFQMLSQTGGTLGKPTDIGDYTDVRHYKLPSPEGARVVYGLLTLAPRSGPRLLLAFTSCRRFSGELRVRPESLQVVLDAEGQELAPGASWELEGFLFLSGGGREEQLARLAERLAESHPPLRFPAPPAGWCSWYCFGPRVTAQQVLDNLGTIAKSAPGLKYVQIDDGYQPAMGDWLETGPAFGGGVQDVLKKIRERGFEPAIWVAPFVAEEGSTVFRQHPEWFVKGGDGRPLRSDRVTFGGWRRGPWYALDGTHPEAQRHLEHVFRTMRESWGCTYFKLDANFWGAIHGGTFHDDKATRIEAYRRGMDAVRRGAGDAFILGCNQPMWASLGLVHGSRSSNDIKRAWDRIAGTARQNLMRNWQNGRLWWNDADALVLTGDLTEDEIRFHATVVYASGGLVLSGDDLTVLPPQRMAMLRRLLPPGGVAARFEDDSLRVGSIDLPGRRVVCLLNWEAEPRPIEFRLARPSTLRDFWTDEDLGRREGRFAPVVPAHGARLLACTPA
jgi:alpha-galactosidase